MKIITLPATFLSIILFSISSVSLASPVNINKADANTIAGSLSGIGKHKAQAIIVYRQKNGLFKKATDIVNVKGIGRATFNKNKMDILIK